MTDHSVSASTAALQHLLLGSPAPPRGLATQITGHSQIPVQITKRQTAVSTVPIFHRNNLIQVKTNTDPIPISHLASFCLLNVRSLTNKSFLCQDFIMSNNLDLLFVTKTWLIPDFSLPLAEACPPGYLSLNKPRQSGRGGGVAVIYRSDHKCSALSNTTFSSFKSLAFLLCGEQSIFCAIIYRPPKASSGFIEEFSEFLCSIVAKYDRILIVGDFIIHVCCPNSAGLTTDFIHLIESFNLVQHVNNPLTTKGTFLTLFYLLELSLITSTF